MNSKKIHRLTDYRKSRSNRDIPGEKLFRAQELIYEAWESTDRRERIALAQNALLISEDCADAWNLLAGYAPKKSKVRILKYLKAVEAGKRVVDEALLKEQPGELWYHIEARPYLRALAGLAQTYWDCEQHDEAIRTAWSIIRLNRDDNQGMRYPLLSWLLHEKDLKGFTELLSLYDEESVFFAWAMVLHAHLTAAPELSTLVRDALALNPYIADYLRGKKKLPKTMPDAYSMGSRQEAVICAEIFLKTWRSLPGTQSLLTQNPSATH